MYYESQSISLIINSHVTILSLFSTLISLKNNPFLHISLNQFRMFMPFYILISISLQITAYIFQYPFDFLDHKFPYNYSIIFFYLHFFSIQKKLCIFHLIRFVCLHLPIYGFPSINSFKLILHNFQFRFHIQSFTIDYSMLCHIDDNFHINIINFFATFIPLIPKVIICLSLKNLYMFMSSYIQSSFNTTTTSNTIKNHLSKWQCINCMNFQIESASSHVM